MLVLSGALFACLVVVHRCQRWIALTFPKERMIGLEHYMTFPSNSRLDSILLLTVTRYKPLVRRCLIVCSRGVLVGSLVDF